MKERDIFIPRMHWELLPKWHRMLKYCPWGCETPSQTFNEKRIENSLKYSLLSLCEIYIYIFLSLYEYRHICKYAYEINYFRNIYIFIYIQFAFFTLCKHTMQPSDNRGISRPLFKYSCCTSKILLINLYIDDNYNIPIITDLRISEYI